MTTKKKHNNNKYYHHIDQPLYVNGHKIHNFSGGDFFLRGLGDTQGLAVNGRSHRRSDPDSHQVHPVEILGEDDSLADGRTE